MRSHCSQSRCSISAVTGVVAAAAAAVVVGAAAAAVVAAAITAATAAGREHDVVSLNFHVS